MTKKPVTPTNASDALPDGWQSHLIRKKETALLDEARTAARSTRKYRILQLVFAVLGFFVIRAYAVAYGTTVIPAFGVLYFLLLFFLEQRNAAKAPQTKRLLFKRARERKSSL